MDDEGYSDGDIKNILFASVYSTQDTIYNTLGGIIGLDAEDTWKSLKKASKNKNLEVWDVIDCEENLEKTIIQEIIKNRSEELLNNDDYIGYYNYFIKSNNLVYLLDLEKTEGEIEEDQEQIMLYKEIETQSKTDFLNNQTRINKLKDELIKNPQTYIGKNGIMNFISNFNSFIKTNNDKNNSKISINDLTIENLFTYRTQYLNDCWKEEEESKEVGAYGKFSLHYFPESRNFLLTKEREGKLESKIERDFLKVCQEIKLKDFNNRIQDPNNITDYYNSQLFGRGTYFILKEGEMSISQFSGCTILSNKYIVEKCLKSKDLKSREIGYSLDDTPIQELLLPYAKGE